MIKVNTAKAQTITESQKWAEIETQWQNFTVEVNGNIYPSSSYDAIVKEKNNMEENDVIVWTETESWNATHAELCLAARAIWERRQIIKNEVLV